MERCARCGEPGDPRFPLPVILCDGCAALWSAMDVRCWRCGAMEARMAHPYSLCWPCVDVVSPEEIAWLDDPAREPGMTTWQMVPMGKAQGR